MREAYLYWFPILVITLITFVLGVQAGLKLTARALNKKSVRVPIHPGEVCILMALPPGHGQDEVVVVKMIGSDVTTMQTYGVPGSCVDAKVLE